MKKILSVALSATLLSCALASCVSPDLSMKAKYEDVNSQGEVSGVGIESQDITAMTDQMIESMLDNKTLSKRDIPARIIVDSKYFENNSNSRINKDLLTDRIRLNLSSNSKNKLVFVSREYAQMVEKERELKRDGQVDGGTIRATQAQAGADFRLTGRISSLDSINSKSQKQSRYHQIIFEVIDLELGTIVWSGLYEFKKAAQDDIIYR